MKKVSKADCPHGALALSRAGASSGKTACEACGETEELRVCQTCGYVGCCESHGAHDTEHFEQSDHPFIRPREGKTWLWCYRCKAYLG
jgi:uncharacterized UBP type Zn finger protein